MNIFNKKLLKTDEQTLPIDPIQLYQTCPYKDGYGYLRGVQEEVLKAWHLKRQQKDVVCKMNTGSGKTLAGLLMLYSKLVETKEPTLYLCPDAQLVEQTFKLAALYGIPVCEFDTREFPVDFVNGKKILITTFQKLFNGKSVFNRHNIKVGAILLDDAHKCVDIARSQSSLRLLRNHEISIKLFKLFQEGLKSQLAGTFSRLESGDPEVLMKVPYWLWLDNQTKIIEIINDYIQKLPSDEKPENNDGIIFKWNFIADNLLTYDCFIGGKILEINPIHVPYHQIPSYNEASHRYILSATFEDDYDLIRDLGISYESIVNPIVPKDRREVGKRLILAPARYNPSIDEDRIDAFIKSYVSEGHNVVVLVPSKAKTEKWTKVGAIYVDRDNIKEEVEKLKSSTGNFMVFNNRYDGIDLHGDLCRILVIDGLPSYGSLQEAYTETRLEALKAGKKAQIIEQGLGRGVRSGADYCVVYLLGQDMVGFLGYEKNMQYFTPVTRVQLNLGLKLLDDNAASVTLHSIKEIASYCLSQDPDWLKFHAQEMQTVGNDDLDDRKKNLLDLAEAEREAIAEFNERNYETAGTIILSKIVNKENIKPKEKAWYYQFAAQMTYLGNKSLSNDLQISARSITTHMFHPPQGNIYQKILTKGAQPLIVKRNIEEFSLPSDLWLHIQGILNGLQYNPEISAKTFEHALAQLGKFLGFTVQMPEKEIGKGPDGLWCMTDNHYLILEAKSRNTSNEISKSNVEQLLHSTQWFMNNYGEAAIYTTVTLQSSNKKGREVELNDRIKVLDKDALEALRNNLTQFGNALQAGSTKAHSEEEISKLLLVHKFTSELFRSTYLKSIR